MKLALYQPDIAQNVGTILRTAACFGVGVEIIEPCGFPFDDRKFRRAGMDYIDKVKYNKHACFNDFLQWKKASGNPRLVLLSSKVPTIYTEFSFKDDDILMLGRESAGVPESVADISDARVTIPMKNNMRSLNVAVSAAIVLSEAIRQIKI